MLTRQQTKALHVIRDQLAREGHAPTLAEIGTALGLRSKGAVHRLVQALVDKGYLERGEGWRALRPTGQAAPLSLPLLGRIAAGQPIEAIPGRDTLNLADFFLGPDRFALHVQGDSMVEAGILDGDTVIVQQRDRAEDGDIVVALIDGEHATLKRIKHRRDGGVTLIPANAALQAVTYSGARVTVQGIVVGLLRGYR